MQDCIARRIWGRSTMDKRALLDRVAATAEERLLLGRVWDKYDQCQRKNIPAATAFLSPQEQAAAKRLLSAMGVTEGFVFFGGYDGAERCQLHFLPEWAEGADEEAVCALRCTWPHQDGLTHRDFLGSLMGLGLTRETIGDILVAEDSADVLVSSGVAEFLRSGWDSAGRVHLQVCDVALHEVHIPQKKTKIIRDTVSSLRLDSVVSTGFSISRGKAAEAISSGRVQLNWTLCTKADRTVAQGDVISLRGLGKCVLEEVGKQTKKGRIFISMQRYL